MTGDKPVNYHDYFIKDGRFIGRFEEMYQNVDDPWHIDALGRRLDMDAALLLVKSLARNFNKILDVGCGKGFFTSLLYDAFPADILALDISPTAVLEARKRFPDRKIEFQAFDLNEIEELGRPAHSFELVVMAQTLWCVLPKIRHIFNCFRNLIAPGGGLLMSQHFLRPGEQKYGAEIIASPDDLIRILEECGYRIGPVIETNRFTNHHLALWAEPV